MVEVEFDPTVLPFSRLLDVGTRKDCASQVFTTTDAQLDAARKAVGDAAARLSQAVRTAEDLKYHLRQGPLQYLPMTPTQAARANADARHAEDVLSPGQRHLLQEIREHPEIAWPNAIGVDFVTAWAAANKLRRAQ